MERSLSSASACKSTGADVIMLPKQFVTDTIGMLRTAMVSWCMCVGECECECVCERFWIFNCCVNISVNFTSDKGKKLHFAINNLMQIYTYFVKGLHTQGAVIRFSQSIWHGKSRHFGPKTFISQVYASSELFIWSYLTNQHQCVKINILIDCYFNSGRYWSSWSKIILSITTYWSLIEKNHLFPYWLSGKSLGYPVSSQTI